jgi:hypothetical protein
MYIFKQKRDVSPLKVPQLKKKINKYDGSLNMIYLYISRAISSTQMIDFNTDIE